MKRLPLMHIRWALLLAPLICACQAPSGGVQADDPKLSKCVDLLMSKSIEIQHFLTKPVDFDGDGEIDGIEAIISTYDSFGDPVKCLGAFNFELHAMRMASGDKLGKRIAHWPVDVDSGDMLEEYWDRLTHSFRFPLQLRDGRLDAGRYIFSARLTTPTGKHLFDDYEFSYGQ